jgi:hypothetical protein
MWVQVFCNECCLLVEDVFIISGTTGAAAAAAQLLCPCFAVSQLTYACLLPALLLAVLQPRADAACV